jgi:hypothetical protein
MRRVYSTLAVLLTSVNVFGVATPASAVTYPVCLIGEEGILQCDYESLKQCRATASGGQGDCIVNPARTSDARAKYRGANRRIR